MHFLKENQDKEYYIKAAQFYMNETIKYTQQLKELSDKHERVRCAYEVTLKYSEYDERFALDFISYLIEHLSKGDKAQAISFIKKYPKSLDMRKKTGIKNVILREIKYEVRQDNKQK